MNINMSRRIHWPRAHANGEDELFDDLVREMVIPGATPCGCLLKHKNGFGHFSRQSFTGFAPARRWTSSWSSTISRKAS